MKPNLSHYIFQKSKEGKRPKYVLSLQSEWKHKTYNDLFKLLKDIVKNPSFKDLDESIIKDYCNFIDALCNIANSEDWMVNKDEDENYHAKIIENRTEESKLRIADIREKIIHERMLQILVKKLYGLDYEHWDKDKEYKDDKKLIYNTGKVFYQTSFSRGKGITEAFVIINKNYRLMIQLQNDQYRRCLILHKISNESTDNRNNRMNNILKDLNKLWNNYNPQNSFGDYFKYSYEKIGKEKTVEKVLDKMAQDLSNIINFYNSKKI